MCPVRKVPSSVKRSVPASARRPTRRWRAVGGRAVRRRKAPPPLAADAPAAAAEPGAAPGGGGGRGGGLTDGLDGLPIIKPPYGVLAAIDLDKGELKFQLPHGDTPDAVRNAPLLAGMAIAKTGQNGSVGLAVTRTLVIAGDPQVTAPPGRPRGAMLRGYDKNNGTEVGAVWLPAAQSGSPMTYMADGKQYFIVAVSGGIYSGEYIAFSLPASETRPTSQPAAPR